ncbi:MAG: hydantoinase/oxoprolinase family protein, partial [Oliverpabstia sp.]
IVRSDGSIMSEEFASLRPVETLLCGPAASAIGCTRLTDNPNSIVVDMGGTTTDIAIIKDGVPVKVTDGVSIGKWKTFVNGLYVKTFGLGGDSAVHYEGKNLYLEAYRVIPLCIAAKKYPSVTDNLKRLEKRKHTRFLYEHYMLIKDISENPRYTDEEKAFCKALKDRPLLITEAAAAVGKEIYSLHVDRLIRDGVVQICGLTPTDVMHIKGDFCEYDAEASRLAAEFAAFNLEITVEELCDLIYDEVKKKLYVNLVKAMLENKYPDYMRSGISSDVERFIEVSYHEAKKGKRDELFSVMFQTKYSLIGVGAPIRVFLEDVSEMLGTHAVIPKNHEVANALGAIVGSVSASCSIVIKPDCIAGGTNGYIVFGKNGNRTFKDKEEAVDYAVLEAEESAKAEAQKRGARGVITVTSKVNSSETEAGGETVFLETIVTAYAAGAVGFR